MAGSLAPLLATLTELEVPCLSDALDRLGIAGQMAGIMPLDRSFRLVGEAVTVKYVPAYQAGATVGDFVDDLEPGQVAVLDNAGRLDATVWGDLMTLVASRRGLAGTVIDGVCRDVRRALELDYPLFARGNWMRTGKDRVQFEALNVPVIIGGVTVRPGDLIFGDANGVLAVPREHASKVAEAAYAVRDAEESIRSAVQQGVALRDARAQVGYHRLQTPERLR